MRRVALLLLPLSLGACQVVPKDGPASLEVAASADVTLAQTAPTASYAVLDLSSTVIGAANQLTLAKNPSFGAGYLGRGASKDVRIGVGDIVAVTIFEASSGGLFIPQEAGSRSGNYVQVPNQQVDSTGNIAIPYAGAVRVAGRSAREVSDEIGQRLRNRAIEPQAVVSIVERRGNDLSVVGEVNNPARFALDPGGVTLLGALARAGGPRYPAHETVITIQRAGRTTQAALSAIVRDPRQNVVLFPGDVVYVSREQRVFMALGSTPSPGSIGGTNNRRFTFENDNMTLAEAVSKAGGLDTARAEAGSIFLFRYEDRTVLASLGVDVSRYAQRQVPTIYRADWTKADGFFLANEMFMRHKDIIYVAEHPTSDLVKFMSVLRALTGPAGDVAILRATAG